MSIQLDMFPAPARRIGGGPPSVHAMWERAKSPAVRDDVLALAGARKGEWLRWSDFRAVIDKHQISAHFGHILFGYSREGLIEEKAVYYGSEHPGPEYKGFYSMWRLA